MNVFELLKVVFVLLIVVGIIIIFYLQFKQEKRIQETIKEFNRQRQKESEIKNE